jgi:DNA (cytosine-5)-methyltransferase 1
MRQGATALFNHSAKRMLGIRRLRLALLKPGDYGTALRRRLETDGLPDELVHELLNGGAATRPIEECRMKDREKEAELRAILRKGGINTEELLTTLDAGGFANKYRRLDWSSPSHTLVAHMARDCSDFVHPNQDRFISVREAARLQSFPDTYQFSGSQFRQFRAIGNAVPPRLGFALATKIASQIS